MGEVDDGTDDEQACNVPQGRIDQKASVGPWAWVVNLQNSYGTSLLVMIFCCHHLLKGFVGGGGNSGVVGSAMDFIYRRYHVSGPRLQMYSSVALIPWSIKALMGISSDGIPLCGFHKAPYILVSTAFAMFAYCMVGLVKDLPLEVLTGCFFLVFLQMSCCDLLVEAKYSEKVKEVPERGPDLISFVWGGISIAHLFSTSIVGMMIERLGASACYLFAIPFASAIVIPTARNALEERRVAGASKCIPKDSKLAQQKPILVLAIVQGTAGLSLAIFSLCVKNVLYNFIAAMTVGFVVLILFSVVCRPVIAKMNAFFFIQNVCHVGIHGAAFYFFTDTASQYPAGPHFSTSFYVTVMGVVASCCSILGMALYTRWGKKWRYRTILAFGSVISMVTQLLNVVVFKRWNLMVGIPDHVFMVCSSALQSVIAQFAWMPGTVMLAQLVPDGLESTMYALLAGSLNLGMGIANFGGAYLLHSLGVRPKGNENEGEQFDNLWLAALISAVGPCIPLVLVRVLIPDSNQTDRLLCGNKGSAVAGSLWDRWRNGSSKEKVVQEELELVIEGLQPTTIGAKECEMTNSDEELLC